MAPALSNDTGLYGTNLFGDQPRGGQDLKTTSWNVREQLVTMLLLCRVNEQLGEESGVIRERTRDETIVIASRIATRSA